MNPTGKALWFIESHFESEMTLDAIADIAGVSRFHITRAFGAATGIPLMRYVRARRLTESARALARGAPDILAVALQAGYGSHEAFTRAFREQFGVTPEAVRAQGTLGNLHLTEPIRMDQTPIATLAPPRVENANASAGCKGLLLAGLGERYTCESSSGIPSQWQRFLPSFGHICGQVGRVAYGARSNFDDEGNFDYLCGVEVPDFSRLPPEMSRLRIPEQRYAVFAHRDHISTIRRTWNTIWSQWLPQSGHEPLDAPDFERYGENFDSRTGLGEVEIWIPLKR